MGEERREGERLEEERWGGGNERGGRAGRRSWVLGLGLGSRRFCFGGGEGN